MVWRVSRWVGLVLRLVCEVLVCLSRVVVCVPAPPGVLLLEPAVGWWVWMVVRFVCVIRVPVSRVCPGSPRSLFTGRWKRGGKCVKDSSRMRGVILV